MNTLLRPTGIGALIRFYRNIYFNGPGVVRLAGIGLMLLVGAIHLLTLPDHFRAAPYVGVAFGVLTAGTIVSVVVILQGRRRGWTLGAALCGVALVAYLISRAFALPGFGEAAGSWTAVGSVAMILEALYLGLYFSIVTGMNVAAPDCRDWHD